MIRHCRPADVAALLDLVRELADFGGDLDYVTATEPDLQRCFFGPSPSAEALVAECAGKVVGHAVYFRTNSTYRGMPGLFLEDLYVSPDFRGRGIGRALFLRIALIAKERDYCKVEWKAYDDNQKAIDFYLSLGATAITTQTPYRLDQDTIGKLCRTE